MADSGFSRQTLPQLIAAIRSDLLTRFGEDVLLRRLDAEVYARVPKIWWRRPENIFCRLLRSRVEGSLCLQLRRRPFL